MKISPRVIFQTEERNKRAPNKPFEDCNANIFSACVFELFFSFLRSRAAFYDEGEGKKFVFLLSVKNQPQKEKRVHTHVLEAHKALDCETLKNREFDRFIFGSPNDALGGRKRESE